MIMEMIIHQLSKTKRWQDEIALSKKKNKQTINQSYSQFVNSTINK